MQSEQDIVSQEACPHAHKVRWGRFPLQPPSYLLLLQPLLWPAKVKSMDPTGRQICWEWCESRTWHSLQKPWSYKLLVYMNAVTHAGKKVESLELYLKGEAANVVVKLRTIWALLIPAFMNRVCYLVISQLSRIPYWMQGNELLLWSVGKHPPISLPTIFLKEQNTRSKKQRCLLPSSQYGSINDCTQPAPVWFVVVSILGYTRHNQIDKPVEKGVYARMAWLGARKPTFLDGQHHGGFN